MCLPIDDRALICWLHTQVRVLEAWRESLASQPDIDIDQLRRLEAHYQWMTGEIALLEDAEGRVANLPHQAAGWGQSSALRNGA